jgi:two-component system, OmpR family, phosphate regulon response regulator PhoB
VFDDHCATAPSALTADDDADTRELIFTVLVGAGISCRCVATGDDAWAAITDAMPRLLVLDVRMPGLSGLEVCRRAKTLAGGQVSVLLVSAESAPDDIAAGYAAGADDYLTKPFRPGELARRVDTLLRATGEGTQSSRQR